uniref:Complement component C9 n=1 Tax=Jaculus jaculus TaxID=51337 RepID=A0A8C5NUR1_JACJA
GSPLPIDCRMSPWSEWSKCDPCLQQRFRSRSIEVFGQFSGRRCVDSLGDQQQCVPTEACEQAQDNCGVDFQCGTGRCIKKRLLCNDDNDCGDFSDEDNCEADPRPPCRNRVAEESEMARTAGFGINILGMDPLSTPFDNEFYNGLCDRVRDGNTLTYFRRPWNVASLFYEVSLFGRKPLRERMGAPGLPATANQLQTPVPPVHLANVGPGESSLEPGIVIPSLFLLFNCATIKEKLFLRVRGVIQLGRFTMRPRDVVLTTTFIDDLKALPTTYEKGEYFAFLETYGTHYSSSGSLGGLYELIYVLNKASMGENGIELNDIKRCLGYNLDISLSTPGMDGGPELKGGLNKNNCIKRGDIKTGKYSLICYAKEARPDLHLGTMRLYQKTKVEGWRDGLAVKGTGLQSQRTQLSPIHSLVPVKMNNAYLKKRNLERAIEDYIDEFDVKKCHPCQNGGTVILMDGQCVCSCPLTFKGIACEIHKQK